METDWHVLFWTQKVADAEQYGEPNTVDYFTMHEDRAHADKAYSLVADDEATICAGVARLTETRTDWV